MFSEFCELQYKNKLFIKSSEYGKNEVLRDKMRKTEKTKEKTIKYACDSGCKPKHIKLIYVLAVSTRY